MSGDIKYYITDHCTPPLCSWTRQALRRAGGRPFSLVPSLTIPWVPYLIAIEKHRLMTKPLG